MFSRGKKLKRLNKLIFFLTTVIGTGNNIMIIYRFELGYISCSKQDIDLLQAEVAHLVERQPSKL